MIKAVGTIAQTDVLQHVGMTTGLMTKDVKAVIGAFTCVAAAQVTESGSFKIAGMLDMNLKNKPTCFWRGDSLHGQRWQLRQRTLRGRQHRIADGSCGSEPFVAASIVYGSGAIFSKVQVDAVRMPGLLSQHA